MHFFFRISIKIKREEATAVCCQRVTKRKGGSTNSGKRKEKKKRKSVFVVVPYKLHIFFSPWYMVTQMCRFKSCLQKKGITVLSLLLTRCFRISPKKVTSSHLTTANTRRLKWRKNSEISLHDHIVIASKFIQILPTTLCCYLISGLREG